MTLSELLTQHGLAIVRDLRDSTDAKGINASGKTKDSIEFEVYSDKQESILTITANKSLVIREKGRGPTQSSQRGNPTLQEAIRKWIDDKPLTPADGISKDSLAFLIARKIHREGYKRKPGLISDVINEELIERIENDIREHYLFNLTELMDMYLTTEQ